MNNNITNFFKSVYSKAYLFIGVQTFAFIIIFFVLDAKTGGSFLVRVFTFLFCILIGGGLAVLWSRKNQSDPVVSFRRGAGTLLMFFTLIAWSNNGYIAPAPKNVNTYSTDSNSQNYTCPHCDGNGVRMNNLTGQLGDCSSCGGDGRVTEEQYGRLSK